MNRRIYIILIKELIGLYLKEKINFITNSNNIRNQKKFYCTKLNFKEEVLIRSKSKKELSKINLQKEIEKLDKKINLNLFLNNLEYFKNFKGFVVLFECNASVTRFDERGDMLGIAFFNQLSAEFDISIFRLNNEVDFETIKFIFKLFFIEDKSIEINHWLKWKQCFNSLFYEMIGNDSYGIVIYEDTVVKFIKFLDLNDLIQFLNRFKFK